VATLTLSGRALPIVGRARIYVCGVTPYDVTHLGHAATFVWADVAARVLRHLGASTEVCRNVTDVDDVLFDAAHRSGERYERLAVVQEYHFEQDMERLAVRRPEHQPRAHAYIPAVQQLAAALLDGGQAYESGGSVYLPGAAVAAAAGLSPAEALAALDGAGGDAQDPAKRDPLDQPIWQRSLGEEPSWPSPWGPGRPGWHAECSAMALSVLGPSVDLHVGGADLRFPHHAFEAAAAEAATGVRPFARAWLHVGVVSQGGTKMAKSTGNLTFVTDLVDRRSGCSCSTAPTVRAGTTTPPTCPRRRHGWTPCMRPPLGPVRARRRPPRPSPRPCAPIWTSRRPWRSRRRRAAPRRAPSSACSG
jgi:cysteinyl-tRNA synthetase